MGASSRRLRLWSADLTIQLVPLRHSSLRLSGGPLAPAWLVATGELSPLWRPDERQALREIEERERERAHPGRYGRPSGTVGRLQLSAGGIAMEAMAQTIKEKPPSSRATSTTGAP